MDDLVAHGAVRRPWIGVRLRYPQTTNVRDAISTGAVISQVTPGSPAARAALRPGDVILAAGSRAIRNAFDWEAVLLDLRVGENIPLRVRRASRDFETTVTVQDLPEVTAPKVQVLRDLEMATLTPAIRAERGIRSSAGALIVRAGDRIADELGVSAGDLVVSINQRQVASAEDAGRLLEYFSGRGVIQMVFERQGALFRTEFIIR